jgi:hypothetical protein
MNASMPRWILASIGMTLGEVAEDLTVPCIVESVNERTKEFEAAPARVEIRVTGPFTTSYAKGFYTAVVDVNVLIVTRNGLLRDMYTGITYAGAFAAAMDCPIPVYNYGNEIGDHVKGVGQPIQVGCLVVAPKRPVTIRDFGQVDASVKMYHREVSTRYVMSWQE